MIRGRLYCHFEVTSKICISGKFQKTLDEKIREIARIEPEFLQKMNILESNSVATHAVLRHRPLVGRLAGRPGLAKGEGSRVHFAGDSKCLAENCLTENGRLLSIPMSAGPVIALEARSFAADRHSLYPSDRSRHGPENLSSMEVSSCLV
jgi:hypothetical protein